MGLFPFKNSVTDFAVSGYAAPNQITGLFSTSTLLPAIAPNIDESAFPVSVNEAMSVPAVARAIGIYSGTASRFPLRATLGGNPFYLPWLTQTDGAITPQLRLATIVQDLIFFNQSLLFVTRDVDGNVDSAFRVHPSRWSIDTEGHILIDNRRVKDSEVVYIPSLMPMGFLEAGRQSVRHYTSLAKTINARAKTPAPLMIISETQELGSTEEEITALMENVLAARSSGDSAVAYQPYGVEFKEFGASNDANAMMTEARMAVRTDLANLLSIDASLLDGSTGSNLVYTNALQTKNELLELSLKLFTEPIADRLSQKDVTAPGVRISFDYSAFDSVADASGNLGTSTEQVTNNG